MDEMQNVAEMKSSSTLQHNMLYFKKTIKKILYLIIWFFIWFCFAYCFLS